MEKQTQDIDYEKAFEEIRKRALQLYPELDKTIEIYNSNLAGSESYRKYWAALNEAPNLVSSNHS
ncbi:MAG TPA: hypothetical protein VNL36_04135 [Bacteroidota bacterium]|nr:hypothetical protein [Bacteroidota bacterium]